MGSVIEQPSMPRLYILLMEHYGSLAAEPPIPLGTPDPYKPKKTNEARRIELI
jgi:hypothetical protein